MYSSRAPPWDDALPSPTRSHRITRMGLVGQGTPSHPRPRIPTPQLFLYSFPLFFPSPLFSFYVHFISPLATPDLGTLGCTSGTQVLRRSLHIWLRKVSSF